MAARFVIGCPVYSISFLAPAIASLNRVFPVHNTFVAETP